MWGERPATVTWSDVYRAERDGLVRLAYLITGSRAVAEDLVQDSFIRVMSHLQPSDRPGPYLRRSVVNACYSWHRRDGRRSARHVPDREEAAAEDGSDLEMWEALDRLGPRRRTVLVLRFYLDLSEAQAAEVLGWRVGTVKSTTHRALADLRRILET
ncbi:MAG TPA: sigma-70 family RNA polymerase sigma factor [Acidimicrobiales bacterium]|nr:sigma-70 family RNA polymerase sigma factor [Acidimicrobiales bacterium]